MTAILNTCTVLTQYYLRYKGTGTDLAKFVCKATNESAIFSLRWTFTCTSKSYWNLSVDSSTSR